MRMRVRVRMMTVVKPCKGGGAMGSRATGGGDGIDRPHVRRTRDLKKGRSFGGGMILLLPPPSLCCSFGNILSPDYGIFFDEARRCRYFLDLGPQLAEFRLDGEGDTYEQWPLPGWFESVGTVLIRFGERERERERVLNGTWIMRPWTILLRTPL